MDFIRVETKANVTTITLNRPEVMNAINPQMHQELQAAFDAFAADPKQHIAVVTGAGEKAFCAGSDLKAVVPGDRSTGYPKSGYAGLIERFDLTKPVIGAVNGLALGGGFEVVLACDIVIAADTATFGLPEPRVGAMAIGGGVHRLVRQIGLKPAMGMLLACQRIDAAQALAWGLVNEVVPAGELMATVERWCAEIGKGAPTAVRATKEAALRGLEEESLAAAIQAQWKYPGWVAHVESPNAREGRIAFTEKRPPNWVDG
jgi:enoyl-CoA hydratase/carnithine racemase